MVYPIALDPETLQPSGAANLSMVSDLEIQMKLKQGFIDAITNNSFIVRASFYSLSLNILRICSGMAGLAFYE